jgi:hypothetical protein
MSTTRSTKHYLPDAYCKLCGRYVAVRVSGKLYRHTDPATGDACDGSGVEVMRVKVES